MLQTQSNRGEETTATPGQTGQALYCVLSCGCLFEIEKWCLIQKSRTSDMEKINSSRKCLKKPYNKHNYWRVHINQLRKAGVYASFSSMLRIKITQSNSKPAHRNTRVDPLKRCSPKKGMFLIYLICLLVHLY